MNKLLIAGILAVLFLASCRKDDDSKKLFIYNSTTVNVTLDANHPGSLISDSFEGLSFENGIFGQDASFLNPDNKVLVQLMRNLGPGIMRMGGGTSDFTVWTGKPRDAGTPVNAITTTDIDRLAALSNATGWPVLFGLNLGENNTVTAANEAVYVNHALGTNLYAFQSGNEPDYFSSNSKLRNAFYDVNDFIGEWDTYQAAVRAKVPGASFAGPDVASKTDWIASFAGREYTSVKLLDGHYYETGPATRSDINYQSILHFSSRLSELIQSFKPSPGMPQLPYRVTECNNVYGGGKQGVSDVFASALWALDTMWILADNGCQGINFHNGIGLHYSPIFSDNGKLTARPEYYAMLAFRYAAINGRSIPLKADKTTYCSAHACSNNGGYSITLINKSIDTDYDFNIIPGKRIGNITVNRLNAPSILATTGTKFAGREVNADGSFQPAAGDDLAVNKNSFIVHVPAASAAVVVAQ
ncbi:MAG: hypothetical protein V4577_05880 [Bacteroidota bacterium]